jgi:hypothetical protein
MPHPMTVVFLVDKVELARVQFEGDLQVFAKDAPVKWDGRPDVEFSVVHKEIVIDATGQLQLQITLKDMTPFLDRLGNRFPVLGRNLPPILGIFLMFCMIVGAILIAIFVASEPEDKLAIAGWIIVKTPMVIVVFVTIGLPVLLGRFRKRLGYVLSGASGFCGFTLGLILGLAWKAAFEPFNGAVIWPDDYIAVARNFVTSTNAIWASVSVYVPVALIISGLSKFELGSRLLALFPDKKGK